MKYIRLITIILSLLILSGCEQTPTTLDEVPYLDDSGETSFALTINQFEFDFLSQQFFFSVEVTSPQEIASVTATVGAANIDATTLVLNDQGQGADILIGDGRYDGNFLLADSLSTYADSLWSLSIEVRDIDARSITGVKQLLPERPSAPIIGNATHQDTLVLLATDLVLDTLTLEVTHPGGLDEIRDVSMMSLKPDGTYANAGQPIPLYDDGGSVVFFSFGGVDFTSGDSLANDGVYSLLLALSPSNLSGVYHWTFNSRSWLGIEAIPKQDSIVVLPAGSLARESIVDIGLKGVFK